MSSKNYQDMFVKHNAPGGKKEKKERDRTRSYDDRLFTNRKFNNQLTPREDAGGLSREYVLRIPSVS